MNEILIVAMTIFLFLFGLCVLVGGICLALDKGHDWELHPITMGLVIITYVSFIIPVYIYCALWVHTYLMEFLC